MKTIRIHQFAPATAVGDGVTTGIFFTQRLLQQLGYQSEIYSCETPDALTDKIQPVDALDTSKTELLLIHHSMGHDYDDLIESFSCRKVMVYHNITPAHFFAEGTPEHAYAAKGRQQLKQWSTLFDGAIGDSPYNSEELAEHNYANISTLPMLIELDKFGQTAPQPPETWPLIPLRPLLISVGRIVENKRQHLLIDAFWHLKQLHQYGPLPQLIIVGGTTSPDYDNALKAQIEKLGLEEDILMPGKCSDAELSWLYQNADCYWCASEHEGFCIPLIESGFFGLPVISFASSNIPATLGEAGLVLQQTDPQQLAAATVHLLDDFKLQRQLIAAGKRNLQRFHESTLLPQLKDYLTTLDASLCLE